MIRDAIEADLSAIVDIYNSAVPSRTITADLEPITVESRIAWFHAHSPHHRPLWVVEDQGTIAGWLAFQTFYGRPAYHATAEISLYIAPAFRRQGVGKKLLQHAIDLSPKLGISTLLGIVYAQNQPSVQLLKQFDFEQWGFLPQVAQAENMGLDVVILGRKV